MMERAYRRLQVDEVAQDTQKQRTYGQDSSRPGGGGLRAGARRETVAEGQRMWDGI